MIEAVELIERENDKWFKVHHDRVLTISPCHRFNRLDRFFTMGSCFAEEITLALKKSGITCLPDYRSIKYDPSRVVIDTLQETEHMSYYNTFSILQEVERAAGIWVQAEDDFWTLHDRTIKNNRISRGHDRIFQDPYRRYTFGMTREELFAALGEINRELAAGLASASAIVITLGTTEVFKKKNNGLVANQIPAYERGGGESETYFHASTFAENYANLKRTIEIIGTINQRAKIVISVSPVPLARSFSGMDIYVANQLSKSTLRAAVGEVCREFPDVNYFPSYEMVTGLGHAAFETQDSRHIRRSVVEKIIEIFVHATFADYAPGKPSARHFDLIEKAAQHANLKNETMQAL